MKKQLSFGGYRIVFSIIVFCGLVGAFFKYSQPASSEQNQSAAPGLTARSGINVDVKSGRPIVGTAVGFAESVAVRDLPAVEVVERGKRVEPQDLEEIREKRREKLYGTLEDNQFSDQDADGNEINKFNRELLKQPDMSLPGIVDGALSTKQQRKIRQFAPPNPPTVNFDGIAQVDTVPLGQGFLPPDTNGDVGPNHYVQTVNVAFRIWDKSGAAVAPTRKISDLFAPLGGVCGSRDDGDPIVIYDQLADRWLISQFCTVADPNNHQVIAISKTGDPLGSYYLYNFSMPNNKFNDYPHFGMWPDAYYMTDNQFNQAGTAFQGGGRFAFDRTKMLKGDPTATYVYFDSCPTNTGCLIGGELPSDLDGFTPPPPGAPNVFAYFRDDNAGDPSDDIRLFDFHVDFATPANSTFTERTGSPLAVAAFDSRRVPNSRNVIPQPAGTALDAIGDRLMFRLAYRNFGASESLILNHTVNAATNPTYRAGVRYYQLNRATPTGAFTIGEQQTFAPADTTHRWMGSGAMNWQGDTAVGFSASSSTVSPSVRYAARLASDTPGTGLAQGEQSIVVGAGAQTSTSGRWGDYSDLTVDPTDDCTFWYTQEYYATTGTAPWQTRIAKFAPGACTASPRGTISGTITSCQTMLPIPNAIVSISGGYSRGTDAAGMYSAILIPGTYNASVTGLGYDTATLNGIVVSNGGTGTFSACLNGNLKQPVADSATVTADSCNSNMAIDPNETVTVSLGVKNTGTLNTANLVGTMQATGGVTSPGGPQTYGVVIAGGAPVFKSYTFTAGNFVCGAPVVISLQLQDGASDLGTVTYNFTSGTISVTNATSGDISVAIPDNNLTGVDIPLPVGLTDAITDVNVSFRANHTFDGDLRFSVVHPDGTVVPLVTNRGSSGANFGTGANSCSGVSTLIDDQAATAITAGAAPFAGSYRPESPLSALNGKPANGTWKLRVIDSASQDTGTVGCFKIEINKRNVCCGAQLTNAGNPAVVTQEAFIPANSAPDPGERVTVNLPLVNVGGDPTTNLVGTLQATGGVTNPSGPQNYGAVSPLSNTNAPNAPPVTRPFSFTAQGICGDNITLTLALQDGMTSYGTVTYTMQLGTTSAVLTTFSNNNLVTIPGTGTGATTGAPANPYPSNIIVSGLVGNIQKVTVTLTGLSHTFPSDVDMLLVSPTGQKFIILSDVIGGTDWVNTNYVLDDAAAAVIPSSGTPVSGTFKPTNYGGADVFPTPAPAAPYETPGTAGTATFASVFNGFNPNGTWSLYIVDDAGTDVGTMAGWSLAITTGSPVCSTTLASDVEVSGRVLTDAGRGLRGTRVTITDETGNRSSVFTGAYGNFRFPAVETGHTYIVTVQSRRFQYAPQVLQVNDNVTDLVFSPQ